MGHHVTPGKEPPAVSQTEKMLDMFLERGAITPAQHDNSLHDLTEKMGEAV